MNDRPYDNREIDSFFKSFREEQVLHHKNMLDVLNRIERQLSSSSERSTITERDVLEIKEWKANLMGKITIIVAVVVFAVNYFFNGLGK